MYVRAVLLSVQPPWAGLLVDGTKTVECRRQMNPATFAEGTVVLVYETKAKGGAGAVIGHFVSGGVLDDSNNCGSPGLALFSRLYGRRLHSLMSAAEWDAYQPRFGIIVREARRWERHRYLPTQGAPMLQVWQRGAPLLVTRPPQSYQHVRVPADLLQKHIERRIGVCYSWGYGLHRTLDDLGALLKAHGCVGVLDVRARPRSFRNPPFNEESLRRFVEANWWYRHRGRLGNSSGTNKWVPLPCYTAKDVEVALGQVADELRGGHTILLLCCEAKAATCHRVAVAKALQDLCGCEVVHLP